MSDTLNELTMEFARRDDCLERMVPSDLRQLIGQRDILQAELAAMREQEPVAWINGERLSGVNKNFHRHWLNNEQTTEDDTPLYAAPVSAPSQVAAEPAMTDEYRARITEYAGEYQHLLKIIRDAVARSRIKALSDKDAAAAIYSAISEHLPLYEDVYDQVIELINPLVGRGVLPNSVVYSVQKLIEIATSQVSAEVVQAEVPETWQAQLTRVHPTIQQGKWPKAWRDEAMEYELNQLRALLATGQEKA